MKQYSECGCDARCQVSEGFCEPCVCVMLVRFMWFKPQMCISPPRLWATVLGRDLYRRPDYRNYQNDVCVSSCLQRSTCLSAAPVVGARLQCMQASMHLALPCPWPLHGCNTQPTLCQDVAGGRVERTREKNTWRRGVIEARPSVERCEPGPNLESPTLNHA